MCERFLTLPEKEKRNGLTPSLFREAVLFTTLSSLAARGRQTVEQPPKTKKGATGYKAHAPCGQCAAFGSSKPLRGRFHVISYCYQ
jgi:hypothetical protein